MIWSSTATGEITYVSEEWLSFTGRPMSAALGEGWLSFLHPDDVEKTKVSFAEALALNAPFTFRYRLRHVADGYVPVVAAATPSFSPIDGAFIGYIGAVTEADAAGLDASGDNLIGHSASIPPSRLTAPTVAIDVIANHLLMARATAVAAKEERMLASLDFAVSEVMRRIGSSLHPTVQ